MTKKDFFAKKLLATIILTIPFYLFSQEETINTNVEVIREYNPVISDAFKINDMPSPSDTLKFNPFFRYQLKGKALVAPPEMIPLSPAKLAKEPLDNLYPAYIKAYAGYYQIIGGQLVYNLVRNEKFAMTFNASHESALDYVKPDKIEDVEACYHETNAGLKMRHFFGTSTLSVDMDFNNFAYRYYGLETLDNDFSETKQRLSLFDINMRLNNRVLRNETYYDVLLGFYTFGNRTGVSENSFKYKGNFDFPLNDFTFRIESAVDYAGTRNDKIILTDLPLYYNFEERSQTLIQVNPSVLMKHKNFLIKLGLRIGAGFDTFEEKDKFYLSPDVAINFTVEDVVMLQTGLTGDIKQNNYRTVIAENPFISPDLNVKTAFHNLIFFAGIKGNFSSKTSFSARFEYGAFSNEHFFVNKVFSSSSPPGTFYYFNNKFDVDYDDGRLMTVSGEIKSKILHNFDISLRAAHYSSKLDTLEKPWHKPDMELGLRLNYKATRDLHFTAAFNVLSKRYAKIPPEYIVRQANYNENIIIEKLAPIFDFNIGVNYTLNSRWHFFTTVQNIFMSKHYMYWHGYPMHGINARIGAGFSF